MEQEARRSIHSHTNAWQRAPPDARATPHRTSILTLPSPTPLILLTVPQLREIPVDPLHPVPSCPQARPNPCSSSPVGNHPIFSPTHACLCCQRNVSPEEPPTTVASLSRSGLVVAHGPRSLPCAPSSIRTAHTAGPLQHEQRSHTQVSSMYVWSARPTAILSHTGPHTERPSPGPSSTNRVHCPPLAPLWRKDCPRTLHIALRILYAVSTLLYHHGKTGWRRLSLCCFCQQYTPSLALHRPSARHTPPVLSSVHSAHTLGLLCECVV